jgi:RNA polymerase sigma factor (sigma-70 family)
MEIRFVPQETTQVARTATSPILQLIRRMVEDQHARDLPDPELLRWLGSGPHETAFQTLFCRHGAMVLDVCRGVLRNEADVEDAFQATFLVFVRKAGSIRKGSSLACWLHGVAYRTALKARSQSARRQEVEARVPERQASDPGDPTWHDVRQVLHEELNVLSNRYKAPLVLCYLEGQTQDEAAAQLGIGKSTLKERLERGRAVLRAQLVRRGLGPAAVVLAAAWPAAMAEASVPTTLMNATLLAASSVAAGQAAASVVSAKVAALMEGVLKSMMLSKLKMTALALLFLAVVGVGATVLAQPRSTPPKAAETDTARVTPEKPSDVDPVHAELRAMRGTWTTTVTEAKVVQGKPLPPREKTVTFVIADDQLIMLGDDGKIDEDMAIKLDPTQKPKTIDLTSRRVGTLAGIYRLEGERLMIGFSAQAGKRPADFTGKADLVWDLKRTSRTPMQVAGRFPNAPGSIWMVEPTPPPQTLATRGIVCVYEQNADGAVRITLAGAVAGPRPPEYRPVLLDAGNQRFLPDMIPGGGHSSQREGPIVTLRRWRMDPKVLPAEKVARIGIEALTPEFHREAARAARALALKEGLEVLPYPEVGQTFAFSLTTTDGKKVQAQDLRGKVVVIDCWASWCAPCISQMPKVQELSRKWRKDGLELIGVSFDNDLASMLKVCNRMGLDWPQVLVPSDAKQRELWQTASGIGTIPRLLVIDRQGILRADNPTDLDQEVGRLLQDSPARPEK